MIFDPEEKEEQNDFFENSDQADEPQPPRKKHSYKPDDPAYWDEEESEWEHLRPRPSVARWIWLGVALLIVALGIGCYLRFFSPYVTDASQFGYVEHIERRGTVFSTYEGVLIPYKELMDTTRIYSRDFIFTAANVELAKKLWKAQKSAMPVRVEYKKYHATVPWRGASKIVVVAVDSVDPAKILPPEFAPRLKRR